MSKKVELLQDGPEKRLKGHGNRNDFIRERSEEG